jgi:hypothetical protein
MGPIKEMHLLILPAEKDHPDKALVVLRGEAHLLILGLESLDDAQSSTLDATTQKSLILMKRDGPEENLLLRARPTRRGPLLGALVIGTPNLECMSKVIGDALENNWFSTVDVVFRGE